MQPLLKSLALAVGILFLGGAVLTAVSDRALAAAPGRDGGAEPTFFPATKAAPMPRPRARDAGEPTYFPASKSFGGGSLPGVNKKLRGPEQQAPQQASQPTPQQTPQQNSAP